MRKIYLAVLLNMAFINLEAQNFDWAKVEGKYAYDYGYGISTDNSHNVYVAGKYEEDAIFSGTTVTCAGNHDMYLAKYSPSGSLIWIRTAGGVLGDYAHAMVCDKANYVYVAGEIEGTNSVIHFSGSSTTLTSLADNDIFLAKYDLDGNLLWARSAGGYGGEKALGVTYDNSGNIYICGNYKDTVTFGGTTTLYPSGERDIFVAKYDANGNFIWAKSAGGPNREEALSIQCNSTGDVYVCGIYSDGAVFGSTTLTTPVTATGHYLNAFLAKYSSDGTMQWLKTAGSDYDDVAWSLTIDNADKVYVAGECNGYVLFDSHPITTVGSTDIFVACYDGSGNVSWATSAGGILPDRARAIGTDGTNLFITGQFGDNAVFGTTTKTAADSADIFISGLDNSGNFLWTKTVTGAADAPEYLGYESGDAICADGPNNIYAAGALLSGGTFGTFSFTGYDRTDAFITKLNMLVGVDELQEDNSAAIYPNPGNGRFTINMEGIKTQKAEVTIYNYLGDVVEKLSLGSSPTLDVDISTQQKGIYFIEVNNGEKVYRKKVILQ